MSKRAIIMYPNAITGPYFKAHVVLQSDIRIEPKSIELVTGLVSKKTLATSRKQLRQCFVIPNNSYTMISYGMEIIESSIDASLLYNGIVRMELRNNSDREIKIVGGFVLCSVIDKDALFSLADEPIIIDKEFQSRYDNQEFSESTKVYKVITLKRYELNPSNNDGSSVIECDVIDDNGNEIDFDESANYSFTSHLSIRRNDIICSAGLLKSSGTMCINVLNKTNILFVLERGITVGYIVYL